MTIYSMFIYYHLNIAHVKNKQHCNQPDFNNYASLQTVNRKLFFSMKSFEN